MVFVPNRATHLARFSLIRLAWPQPRKNSNSRGGEGNGYKISGYNVVHLLLPGQE